MQPSSKRNGTLEYPSAVENERASWKLKVDRDVFRVELVTPEIQVDMAIAQGKSDLRSHGV